MEHKNSSNKPENEEQRKKEILMETYGCFESAKTADEIIDEIHDSRCFRDKNLL